MISINGTNHLGLHMIVNKGRLINGLRVFLDLFEALELGLAIVDSVLKARNLLAIIDWYLRVGWDLL